MTSYATIWEEALNELKQLLPDYHFKTFFINAAPFHEDHGSFYFEVNNPNEKRLLSMKYADKVASAIASAYETLEGTAPDVEVIYMLPEEAQAFREQYRRRAEAGAGYHQEPEPEEAVDAHDDGQDPEPAAQQQADSPASRPMEAAPAPRPQPEPLSPAGSQMLPLNPGHTFDSFVVGESNKLANAAAQAVADNPGYAYNPLFLCGGVGLGKTHLMHAIGNQIRGAHPEKKIVYVTSETFTNELISMIRSSNSVDRRQEFRDKYRKADVLMIDDIQFIAGKDTTQDEFFHTFNALHGEHKQIVISSDRPPKELTQLEDRMKSRFEWGLIADIQMPDYETRVAILQKKHSERPDMLPIDDDVFYYMAEETNVNIRSLEGSLARVNMYAELHQKQRIDMATAKKALQELNRSQKQRQVTAAQVVSIVCEYFGVDEADVLGSRRTKDVAFARQVSMYVIRKLTDLSLSKIAAHFNKKDHTTVMHAERTVTKAMAENANTEKQVEDVIARLRNA